MTTPWIKKLIVILTVACWTLLNISEVVVLNNKNQLTVPHNLFDSCVSQPVTCWLTNWSDTSHWSDLKWKPPETHAGRWDDTLRSRFVSSTGARISRLMVELSDIQFTPFSSSFKMLRLDSQWFTHELTRSPIFIYVCHQIPYHVARYCCCSDLWPSVHVKVVINGFHIISGCQIVLTSSSADRGWCSLTFAHSLPLWTNSLCAKTDYTKKQA